ncbi:heme ABC exporter ATP-binding protein CcmA [Roseomonas sp. NAR14]|uniref:Heme ABC exporter ATP-binding protein CcmA n=1 Tax=Roseomonas acroporae TaxID=2937791 RepID=A0A9X1Y862_9PROT|nr:heme ABC exporter ATP-binding protein CcmA [Roseomonas acroporae]MCK8785256.1 heme ABC exporter ATP-binding protein CcmA [Roseomonas acroporae]
MLEAEDLACLRGERAVFAGLGFRLAPGGALLLTGANGAGKSSLLRLLAGLLAPAAGRLLWAGEDVQADRAAHARRLRYVGHADAAKPALTLRENLALYARLWGGDAAAALAALDLAPLAELPARVLSAGQRRRLALARLALVPAATAPLWLLDEPTVGLDAASVGRLGALLAAHRAGGGMVVAATHLPLPLPGAGTLAL